MNIFAFIVGIITVVLMNSIIHLVSNKSKKTRNKVHFYVARNYNGELNVYLNKPSRNVNYKIWMQYSFKADKDGFKWHSTRITEGGFFKDLGLKTEDYKYLQWEDEPVEVFLNLED